MKALHAMAGGLAACLAATVLFGTPAHAQQAEPAWTGFYLGGGGNYSTVSVKVGGSDCGYDCYYWWGDYPEYDEGDGDYGYTMHAGWRIHPYVALEANYLETGNIRWDEDLVYMPEFNDFYNNRVDFTAKVTELSVLGLLPFAGRWEVYLRLGAGFWDGESAQYLDQSFGNDVVTRQVSDDGTGFLGGIGLGVTLAKSLHLRLEFQTLTIDKDVLNARDDTSLDSVLFEMQYRFGARNAPAPLTEAPAPTP
jgi:opacity protein-like surface antigen